MMYLFLLICTFISVVNSITPALFDDQTGEWINVKLYPKPNDLPRQSIPSGFTDSDVDIFVGIAHYRDGRCAETLKNLFSKAKHPERVHVGIMQHIHTEEDKLDCKKDYCRATGYTLDSGKCPHANHIQEIVDSFKDARGPGVSRYMQQQHLLGHEEFCLQVDAHTDFVKNWDDEMIATWHATNNEYAIISTRPPDLSDPAKSEGEVNHVCQAAFTSS
jgi:hypothetical protein